MKKCICFYCSLQVFLSSFARSDSQGALDYEFTTDVQSVRDITLDHQRVVTRLALGTEAGLNEALGIYQDGRLAKLLEDYPIPSDASLTMFPSRYLEYYQTDLYADEFLMAAFGRRSINFPPSRGTLDFSATSMSGIAEAIDSGTLILTFWMHILQNLEKAVTETNSSACSTTATSSNSLHTVPAWDQAIATYAGVNGDGSLFAEDSLYDLAQVMCRRYNTCRNGDNEEGMAQINIDLWNHFREGKQALQECRVSDATSHVQQISRLLTVPLIQGLLFHSYILDVFQEQRDNVETAEATFAAAILPQIHSCSPGNADLIRKNIKLMSSSGEVGSYEAIRGAMERQYACLGVTCEQIGGLVDPTSGVEDNVVYRYNAQPCGSYVGSVAMGPGGNDGKKTVDQSTSANGQTLTAEKEKKIGTVLGISLASLLLIVLVALVLRRACWTFSSCRVSRGTNIKEFDSATDGTASKSAETECETPENPGEIA